MKKRKAQTRPRQWAKYEAEKERVKERVIRSGKEGLEAAELYQREIKLVTSKNRI